MEKENKKIIKKPTNIRNDSETDHKLLESVTRIFSDSDHSKSTFCEKLAKMNISVVKRVVERGFWTLKTTFL